MGSDLQHCVVQDIALEMGDAPFGSNLKTKDYTNTGALVVQGKNIQGRSFDWTATRHVTVEKYESIPRSHCYVGDLIFPKVGTIGKVGILSPCAGQSKYLLSTNSMRLKVDPIKASHLFIYYYFTNQKTVNLIHAMNSKSVQPVFNYTSLKNFPLDLPDLTYQVKAANVLDTLDNKIELNRQTNETLEKMAQALFKSWFVDFDPVIDNALEAGNTVPDELQNRAERRQQQLAKPDHQPLPDDIRQLFPSEFELTEELGWVPMGWEVKSINDLAQVIKGKSYKSSELEESKTALITLKSFMRGGGYRLDGLKEYTGKYKPEQEVFAGDLVVAYTDVTQAADVIGKPAMVISDARYEHLVISLDVAVIRPGKDNYKYFLYGLAQTEKFQIHTHSHSTGTTVLHLGKAAVPEYSFSKPSDGILECYIHIVERKYRSIDANIQSSRVLGNLRDTLLPKLISGELRLPLGALPDAEQQLADATS